MSRNAFNAIERQQLQNDALRDQEKTEREAQRAKTEQDQAEELCNEAAYLREMVAWSYGKLHGRTFSNIDDAMMLDRMNLYLQHGIAG